MTRHVGSILDKRHNITFKRRILGVIGAGKRPQIDDVIGEMPETRDDLVVGRQSLGRNRHDGAGERLT